MVHGDIKHVKGGGVHYVAYFQMQFRNYSSPESRLFKAGLKHDPKYLVHLTHGRITKPSDLHDKMDYERVDVELFRALSSTRGHQSISTSTSITCSEASAST